VRCVLHGQEGALTTFQLCAQYQDCSLELDFANSLLTICHTCLLLCLLRPMRRGRARHQTPNKLSQRVSDFRHESAAPRSEERQPYYTNPCEGTARLRLWSRFRFFKTKK
jgi:hypothetical protein